MKIGVGVTLKLGEEKRAMKTLIIEEMLSRTQSTTIHS